MSDRTEQAAALRAQGLSFRRIGNELGVSHERARQMVAKQERIESRARRARELSLAVKIHWIQMYWLDGA